MQVLTCLGAFFSCPKMSLFCPYHDWWLQHRLRIWLQGPSDFDAEPGSHGCMVMVISWEILPISAFLYFIQSKTVSAVTSRTVSWSSLSFYNSCLVAFAISLSPMPLHFDSVLPTVSAFTSRSETVPELSVVGLASWTSVDPRCFSPPAMFPIFLSLAIERSVASSRNEGFHLKPLIILTLSPQFLFCFLY